MKQEKCCGSCKQFSYENMDGLGICEQYNEFAHCSDTPCEYWEEKEEKDNV